MTDSLAGWYDDPEDPAGYRYWDGTEWTIHRSPKTGAAVGPAKSPSPWQIFPDSFALLAKTWREVTLFGLPLALFNILGTIAVFKGLESTISASADEFLDRVTTPGFDPSFGADEIWWDSLDPSFTSSTAAWIIVAVVALTVASLWAWLVFAPLFAATRLGTPVSPSAIFGHALRRAPRLIGFGLLVMGIWVAALGATILLAFVAPPTLLLTVPALLLVSIWLMPYLTVAAVAACIAPADRPLLAVSRDVVTGRWWKMLGRIVIVILVAMAVGLPFGLVGNQLLLVSLWGYVAFSGITQIIQVAASQAAYTLAYLSLDGPIDEALHPAEPEPTVASPS